MIAKLQKRFVRIAMLSVLLVMLLLMKNHFDGIPQELVEDRRPHRPGAAGDQDDRAADGGQAGGRGVGQRPVPDVEEAAVLGHRARVRRAQPVGQRGELPAHRLVARVGGRGELEHAGQDVRVHAHLLGSGATRRRPTTEDAAGTAPPAAELVPDVPPDRVSVL